MNRRHPHRPRTGRFLANLPLWITDDLIQHVFASVQRRLGRSRDWLGIAGAVHRLTFAMKLGMSRMPDHEVPFIEACFRAVRRSRPPSYNVV